MSSREARFAKNEATSREIKEQIEGAHQATPRDRHVRMLCECARERCNRMIAITREEYERVRSDPKQFAVVREHLAPDVESVAYETDRFAVVVKRVGTPAAVAIEQDPRS